MIIDPWAIEFLDIYLAFATAVTGMVLGCAVYAVAKLWEPL